MCEEFMVWKLGRICGLSAYFHYFLISVIEKEAFFVNIVDVGYVLEQLSCIKNQSMVNTQTIVVSSVLCAGVISILMLHS